MPRTTHPKDLPPAAAGVEEAASEYVGVSDEYRRYIQEGLDDIAAGRTRPWEEVKAELRAKYGIPKG